MDVDLIRYFDTATLQRGRDYASRGLVISVDPMGDGALTARVSNGRGTSYRQQIIHTDGWLDGHCTCPVGHNCKHVAAVMTTWSATRPTRPGLAAPTLGWLQRITESAALPPRVETRPDPYPDKVKDRLLYVLSEATQVRIDICKGRINAANTGLNRSIRRYDAAHALRSADPAQFIRPVDLELLSALAQARLWEAGYGHALPEPLRPKARDAITVIRRLCETGRFLYDTRPDAHLSWSEQTPLPRLSWRMAANGRQRLAFVDATGQPLHLRSLGDATLWVDTEHGRIGALDEALEPRAIGLVESSPEVDAQEARALGPALPDTLAGLDLPRPRDVRRVSTRGPAENGASDPRARECARRAALFRLRSAAPHPHPPFRL